MCDNTKDQTPTQCVWCRIQRFVIPFFFHFGVVTTWVLLGRYLSDNKIIEHHAYWALYGAIFGIVYYEIKLWVDKRV